MRVEFCNTAGTEKNRSANIAPPRVVATLPSKREELIDQLEVLILKNSAPPRTELFPSNNVPEICALVGEILGKNAIAPPEAEVSGVLAPAELFMNCESRKKISPPLIRIAPPLPLPCTWLLLNLEFSMRIVPALLKRIAAPPWLRRFDSSPRKSRKPLEKFIFSNIA